MTLRIRPNLSITLDAYEEPTSLGAYLQNETYWPASRTANLVIWNPSDNTNPVFICVGSETISARVIFAGEVKVFGPIDRETLDTMTIVASDIAVEDALSIIVALDEVLSE